MAKYQCPNCYAYRLDSKKIEEGITYSIIELLYGCGAKAYVKLPSGVFEWVKECKGESRKH